ncbi:DUF3892 domain-containing protein [Stenotrophomonas maltophilia]|uniref:DUF3892 domain-containing protein n=1 Tax=Stenotrophomonas maltophilia TaxID=40324 RepID=A0A246ID63_STEMA|nr:DUF3892 domain-containing protein [Stenotrophomonas maltophilia]OWQ77966.1 hypothetical protein CEE63_02845 [Stenotrophomonas maltophilia]
MAHPDFYVSAVKYNSDSSHIAKLRVHVVDKISGRFRSDSYNDMTRPEVIELIAGKKTFVTIVKKTDGSWSRGADLEITSVKTDYLKTVRDQSTKDNLENLPTF